MDADNQALREHLVELIRGGSAHVDAKSSIEDFPEDKRGAKPKHAPYNAWQLLWHVNFTLRDLREFCTNPKYVAPNWPGDYWPQDEDLPSADAWDAAARALQEDLAAFEKMIMDPAANLYAKIPWGDGQTILREILLAADHNSYHLGQLILLRKLLKY